MASRCGYVVLVGRPNVGKSTLLNRLVGTKIAIVSRKPQATRHRILGIYTDADTQMVFVDTPGMHRGARKALNRSLNRAAAAALADADVLLFIVEALQWTEEDQDILERIGACPCPHLLLVNKIDRVAAKGRLLPYIDKLRGLGDFAEIIPLSALHDPQLERLRGAIRERLPEGPLLFPAEQLTDRSEQFIAAEIIREKLMDQLHEELPYGLTVEIESYTEEARGVRIGAVIWVDRERHKAIVIGRQGTRLKRIGRAARLELKERLAVPVHLDLWVKVQENWTRDEGQLRRFGYES